MPITDSETLTLLLQRASSGEQAAVDQLLSIVYPELRRMASKRLRLERSDHTLQPTALVNEVYLRLFGALPINWQNRAHFFALAAKHMRFILVEHARNRRGGAQFTISLEGGEDGEPLQIPVSSKQDLLELDEVLGQLEAIDPRAAHGVELRYFVGLTQQEIAEIQKIDVATVKRDWVFAKAWLHSRLKSSA
ncbi:MAG: sigma-70 family RNA polymerase sigma factor [Acidobacteria bacterium]|nr:sigma-70 family RNA polymerase sigma factor [Acidobacteriota bacterium]MBI3423206.1 sigma-70 family RNA polymerase sigma factor [Acidobacteriota bacterium]